MKRSRIQRASAVKRHKALTRRAIQRRRAHAKTGPDKDTVKLVLARAAESCERCGFAPPSQLHHRKPRGAGGTSDPAINLPSNLLALCAPCHLEVERDRDVAREQGWLVRNEHNPANRPVWLAGRGYCFLTDDGSIHDTDEEAA